MSLTYFKRYHMELRVQRVSLPAAMLPEGYAWKAWDPGVCLAHARVKYESFVDDIDSEVFPCLGDRGACRKLMYDIVQHVGFLPATTWLVEFAGNEFAGPLPCGTIQGLTASPSCGNIQNVGVLPGHRGHGLGRALVLKALAGFQAAGLSRVALEVTATNECAVRLYRALGFKVTRTTYRKVDIPRTRVPHDGSLAEVVSSEATQG